MIGPMQFSRSDVGDGIDLAAMKEFLKVQPIGRMGIEEIA